MAIGQQISSRRHIRQVQLNVESNVAVVDGRCSLSCLQNLALNCALNSDIVEPLRTAKRQCHATRQKTSWYADHLAVIGVFSPRVADRVRLSMTSKGFLSGAVLATSCRPPRSLVTTAGFVAARPATGVEISRPPPNCFHRSPALARIMHAAAPYKMTRCHRRALEAALSRSNSRQHSLQDPR